MYGERYVKQILDMYDQYTANGCIKFTLNKPNLAIISENQNDDIKSRTILSILYDKFNKPTYLNNKIQALIPHQISLSLFMNDIEIFIRQIDEFLKIPIIASIGFEFSKKHINITLTLNRCHTELTNLEAWVVSLSEEELNEKLFDCIRQYYYKKYLSENAKIIDLLSSMNYKAILGRLVKEKKISKTECEDMVYKFRSNIEAFNKNDHKCDYIFLFRTIISM
jgi:hypothetical protein